jgi:uncharacterized repeat protein (TIGR01451 family)
MRTTVLAGVLLLVPALAAGEAPGKLVLTTTAEEEIRTVNDKGETEIVRVAAEKVTPGDEIIYIIHYRNESAVPAAAVVITNPVPEHMTCRRVEDASARVTYSVDGGASFDTAENLTVAGPEGEARPATPADFTHIRWTLTEPVGPGGEGTVSFRAVLQ